MLTYSVDLPSLPDVPAAADVVKGVLQLIFNGVAQPPIDTTVGQTTIDSVEIEQDTQVEGNFVFMDDAGNVSHSPTVLTPFTATDTIPPPDAVGGLGMHAVSES